MAWGDYDNDGDLDILLTGFSNFESRISKVYRNTNGTFSDISASLIGVKTGSAEWGDYDNDGDLDILLSGEESQNSGRRSLVYQNTNGTFSDISAGLVGVRSGSMAWGDYDNDGDLDIALVGITSGGVEAAIRSKVYRNDGLVFNRTPNAPTTGMSHLLLKLLMVSLVKT